MATTYTIQHQVCTNDSNGNPRRLWYVSQRIADQYNRPYRNDERPVRVHVIANG